MKLNARNILPIIFGIALPGLGMYSSAFNYFEQQFTLLQRWAFSSFVMIVLWYVFWHFIDFRAKDSKWKIVLGLTFLAGLAIAIIQPWWFDESYGIQWLALARMIIGSILILTIQYALKTQDHIAQLRLEKEQIQTENYRVQLSALSTKIDPHFLFNSLNTLRSMVRQQHENSEEFILSLSDFYRQILKHNEQATISLSDELEVLNSYLFLMKNRNEQAVTVEMNINHKFDDYRLPILGLQSMVENCFKHNTMTSKQPLHIYVRTTDDGAIEVMNNLQPKLIKEESTGLGLSLLAKRYELLHLQNAVLVEQTAEQFRVKLKLISP